MAAYGAEKTSAMHIQALSHWNLARQGADMRFKRQGSRTCFWPHPHVKSSRNRAVHFIQKDCAMSSYACVKVLEAAAIGVPHPKWTERPLLVVVPHPGQNPSKDELLSYFQVRSAYRQATVLHPTKELFMPFLMVPGPLAGSQPDVHQHDPIGCGHVHLITSSRSASVAR